MNFSAPLTFSDEPALSKHRAPPVLLPADPLEAAAMATFFISGIDHESDTDAYGRSGIWEGMAARLTKLGDMSKPEALDELKAQTPLLHAAFVRLTLEAFEAKTPKHRDILMKLALQVQQTYARTITLLAGLEAQQKGLAAVAVHGNDLIEG